MVSRVSHWNFLAYLHTIGILIADLQISMWPVSTHLGRSTLSKHDAKLSVLHTECMSTSIRTSQQNGVPAFARPVRNKLRHCPNTYQPGMLSVPSGLMAVECRKWRKSISIYCYKHGRPTAMRTSQWCPKPGERVPESWP